jgi:thioredoxin-like negative regulator of GroEL
MIAPAFESMVAEFPSVVFAKVDVDANQETASHCGVRSMPTFQLFKGGEKVAETKGANEQGLRVIMFATDENQASNQLLPPLLFSAVLVCGSDCLTKFDLCNV